MNDTNRIKRLANQIVEYLTPYVQKLSKFFKAGFIGHIVLELAVMLIMFII